MNTAARILTFVSALSLLVVVWLLPSNTASGAGPAEALHFELQNASFCPLSWSLAQFRLSFLKEYGECLQQLDQALAAKDDPAGALKNAQLAEVLVAVLDQARTALPLDLMESHLLRLYRNAGLTNQYLELRAVIQRRNTRSLAHEKGPNTGP